MFDDNSENMSIEFSRCVSFKCIDSNINIIYDKLINGRTLLYNEKKDSNNR